VRHGILFTLLAAYLGVVAVCVALVGLPLHLVFRRDYVANAHRAFRQEVARLSAELRAGLAADSRQDVDAACARINSRFEGRVTVLTPRGRVLGDSMGALCLERARPECVERIRGAAGRGENGPIPMAGAVTLSEPVETGDGRQVSVRLALPLEPVHEHLRKVNVLLLLGAMGAGALAACIGLVIAGRIGGPLREMTRVAEEIAAGDFGRGVRLRGPGEIGRLADAINRMRADLERSVRALAEERNQILAIIKTMSEGVLALAADGQVQIFNRAAERLLSCRERLRVGARFEELGPPEALAECVRRVRATGRPSGGELGRLDAGETVTSVVAGPVADRAAGIVIVAHDVTESRRMESLGREFVANASHELRTPLAAILSTAEALLSGPCARDAESREFLETIMRQAERLRALVAGTLELSRIDAAGGAPKAETVEADFLVEEAAGALASEAEQKGQRLEVEPAGSLTVQGDPHWLLVALRNLVENAVRYTPERGQVRVRAFGDGEDIVFEVSDSGPGIPPDEQRRVFDRFFRGRRAAESGAEGSGLGLSIVERVARAHRGRVELEGAEGGGSTFRLRVPRDRAHGPPSC